MKKGFVILLLTAITSVGAYSIYYHRATASTEAMLCDSSGEMEWLRHEFRLDRGQFDKIKALHEAYLPKCERMCKRIAEAQGRLDSLIESNRSVTPEIGAALKDCAAVQIECRQALLAHIYAVSAEMRSDSGTRYVQMMKASILQPVGSNHAMKHGGHEAGSLLE